jgi:hypothetical protein
MAHCSPLGGAFVAMVEIENMDEAAIAAELERAFGENPATYDSAKRVTSLDDVDIPSEGAPDNEELHTYYFKSSTITVGKIKEMEEKGYFTEDEAHTPGAETVSESNNDEAMVYKDFFVTSLCMPPHPALADILLYF